MRAGLEAGQGPRTVALDLVGRVNRMTGLREGGIIGLNSSQKDYVISARRELASGDPGLLRNYLTRARRDANFDRFVARSIASGKPIAAADIDRMTSRYKDRLLQLRAETIARTESITALRAGKQEGYRQLVDSGAVRDDQITRTWSDTGDGRTRPSHHAANGQKVRGLNTPFQLSGGQVMFPGDTSLGAPASLTANCRCLETIRIRFIE